MIRTKVPMTLIMVIQRRTSIYGELVACQTLCPCFTWSHLISPSHERYENQYWSVLQRKSGSERFLPLNPGSHSWLGVEPGITHKLCDFRNRAPSHSPGPSSKMLHESLCRSPGPACLEPMFRRAGRALAKRKRLGVRSLHSTPGGSDLLYGSISLSNMGQKNPCVKSLPLPNVEDFKERKLIWRFYMEKLPINVGLDFQPPS